MERRTKRLSVSELKVGIVVLVSIVIFLFMVLTASGGMSRLFSKPFIVKTRFAEVDGLLPGHEVRLAGKRVGNVMAVNFYKIPEHPEDLDTVEVVMSVDPEIARKWIRDDSKATLGSIGLLGDKVVEISPGTKHGKPIHSGDYIPSTPGTNIRKIISGVDPLIADLTDTAEQIKRLVVKVNEGEGTLGRLINDPSIYEEADRFVLELRSLLNEVREGRGTLGQLITDPELYHNLKTTAVHLERVVESLDEGDGTIAHLINDPELYNRVDRAISQIQQTADRLNIIAARIERGEGTLGRLINDPRIAEETEKTMTHVSQIMERVNQGQGTVGALLHERELYDNLNALSSQLVRLVYDFRQNPKKYLRVKVSIF